jgi:hypothetical protein
MGWIKTKDKLPRVYQQVSIYWTHPEFGDKKVGQGTRRHNGFEVITTYGDRPEILKLTYDLVDEWQPLPEKP